MFLDINALPTSEKTKGLWSYPYRGGGNKTLGKMPQCYTFRILPLQCIPYPFNYGLQGVIVIAENFNGHGYSIDPNIKLMDLFVNSSLGNHRLIANLYAIHLQKAIKYRSVYIWK